MAHNGVGVRGGMPGMATPAELAALRHASGDAAEVLFLQLMIDHHREGVAMADAVVERTDHDVVRGVATFMVSAQRSDIDAVRALLRARRQRAADDRSSAAPQAATPDLACAHAARARSSACRDDGAGSWHGGRQRPG